MVRFLESAAFVKKPRSHQRDRADILYLSSFYDDPSFACFLSRFKKTDSCWEDGE